MTAPSPAFHHRGEAIAHVDASPATVAWLEEMLGPWIVPGPASPSAPRVRVSVDGAGFRAVVEGAKPTGEHVACFTMDRADERLPVVRTDAGAALAVDARLGVALGVGADRDGVRTIDVLAGAERPGARLVLVRVLRELAAAGAAARGGLILHAAAVEAADGVTLFVGGKEAGKSTMLVHALGDPGTRYVANDRVVVVSGGVPAAFGMPTVVSLRAGTLDFLPALRDEVASGAWHFASTVAEARAHRARGTTAEGAGLRRPPGLSPRQLCTLLDVAPAAGGRLARIVLPEVRPSAPRRFVLRRLTPAEAVVRLLADGLFAGGATAPFLTGAPPVGAEVWREALAALAAAVPVHACTLGPDAYVRPSVVEVLLTAAVDDRADAVRLPP